MSSKFGRPHRANTSTEIGRARDSRGLTLGEVCESTGLNDSTLHRIESGQYPKLADAMRLAKFYETPVEDLWPFPGDNV